MAALNPPSYEVTARLLAPGISEIDARRERIRFDSSPGRSDQLPGPAELLCGALAACILKNVERFSELLSFSQHGALIRVSAERQERPPLFTQIRYELRLVTEESPRRLELLRRNLAAHGTVYNTLAGSCDVDGEVIAVDSLDTPRYPPEAPGGL